LIYLENSTSFNSLILGNAIISSAIYSGVSSGLTLHLEIQNATFFVQKIFTH
jgi:hypothetical protein